MFHAEVIQQVTRGFTSDTKIHTVATSFAQTMLEPMMQRYSLYPAKGTTIAHFAHNSDQMMSTHILNGLFPTFNLIYEAQKRNLYRLSRPNVEELKVYVVSYCVHDLDKILGDLKRFHTRTNAAVHDAYGKLSDELEILNARAFLPEIDQWIPEILWLAVNTQRSRDINLSHTAFSSYTQPLTDEIVEAFRTQKKYPESILRDLCTFSDLVAFVVKSPEDAVLNQGVQHSATRIQDLIKQLTYTNSTHEQFSLVYHKLSEVRGLLSNQINNAIMRYMSRLYPADQDQFIPYLFFPNGVVYLNPRSRSIPTIDQSIVNTFVQSELQEVCKDFLDNGIGFGFDPKGRLAYPRYFHDFLDLKSFLHRFAKNTLESRANIAENTLQAMKALQDKGIIPADINLNYTPEKRISQLGRFLLNYVDLFQKNLDKNAIPLKEEIERRLMVRFGVQLWNEAKRISSSGGVDYRYYWLAAQYLSEYPLAENEEQSPGSSLEGLFQQCIDDLLEVAGNELALAPELQGTYLHDLSNYLEKNLSFGLSEDIHVESLPDFAGELAVYAAAKKQRGSQLSCTICNSVYTTRKQEDASVLFQPWVYKNRLPLYKSENAGGICSICSLELMLRQLLLRDGPAEEDRVKVKGKDYEDMELKYFFLYPGFFFTNQTYHLTLYIINKMKNLKLYEVYEVLREQECVDVAAILSLNCFDITARSEKKAIERGEDDEKERQEGRGSVYLRERYDKHQYPGFLFFAKKIFSKKNRVGDSTKTTTASWVEAAWLALALPLITGSRVVVTEEYLPLYNSAADFLETVILDAPHRAIRYLLPQSSARLRLDELYGDRQREGDYIGGAMAALSRAIELHIDTERSAGDLKLERFSRIVRLLAQDQLYIFSFLKEQMRRDKLDFITAKKAIHYNNIYRQFFAYYHAKKEGGAMSDNSITRHEKVTELYLQFYSPFKERKGDVPQGKNTWPNSHAIVRPIDIAAKSILKDSLNMTSKEIKFEMVQSLESWLDVIEKKGATGQVRIRGGETRRQLIRQFVDAFYDEVFLGYAEGRRSVLNSRLNRFKGGCEEAFALWVKKRSKTHPDFEEPLLATDDSTNNL